MNASAAYLVPFESSTIALYESSGWVARTMGATAQLPSPSVANTSYDVYAYWSGSDVLLEMATTPGTPALVLQDGVQVKGGDPTRRYLGVLATNASGKFEDSAKNRLVWNRNNQVPRRINGADPGDWYLTGNGAWREVNDSATNRVKVASGILNGAAGLGGTFLRAHAVGMCIPTSTASNGVFIAAGIGIDSTTTNSAQIVELGAGTTTSYAHAYASYEGQLGPGLHSIHWLEIASSGNFYCFGATLSPSYGKIGVNGSVLM